MNTTDNPSTWRDIANELTPDQIAYLERWEANPHLPVMQAEHADQAERQQGSMLFAAQEFAEANHAGQQFAHVPMPPDSRVVDRWHRVDDDVFDRYFDGTTRRDNTGVRVFISGRQYQDGRVEREISLSGRPDQDDRLSADEAGPAARMLLDAADELDRLER